MHSSSAPVRSSAAKREAACLSWSQARMTGLVTPSRSCSLRRYQSGWCPPKPQKMHVVEWYADLSLTIELLCRSYWLLLENLRGSCLRQSTTTLLHAARPLNCALHKSDIKSGGESLLRAYSDGGLGRAISCCDAERDVV